MPETELSSLQFVAIGFGRPRTLEFQTAEVMEMLASAQAGQPAFEVAAYLQRDGVEVIPVPVFYPDVQEILGVPVYRKLQVRDDQIVRVVQAAATSPTQSHLCPFVEVLTRLEQDMIFFCLSHG